VRTQVAAILIVCAAVGITPGAGVPAQQAPAAPQPIVGPPLVPLAESYLKWPLPALAAAYGRIDGAHLKPYVEQLAAISRKSRDAGDRWWGRITGTPAHAEAQQLVAAKLRGFGMDVRLEETPLPPAWFPTAWAVSIAGRPNVVLQSAQPVLRSTGTPTAGLDLEPVYVGLGTPADFAGRDVRGKAAVIYSIPTPSALNHSAKTNGAMLLAEEKGAAAIIIILGIPGNFTTQLWGSGGEGPNLTKVPWFSVGLDDGIVLRERIERGTPLTLRMRLVIESRTDLKPSAVFGVLPGMTDENILVIAHTDGF